MRASLRVNAVGVLAFGLLAQVSSVAIAARRPGSDGDVVRHSVQCSQADESAVEYARDQALNIITDPDSGYVEKRERHGLSVWPEDSVTVTTDATVCHHIDSLITIWFSTPAGVATGARRNETWGPLLVMMRINPGRYYVWPGVADSAGWAYNFIVDSVGGSVAFYKTPF